MSGQLGREVVIVDAVRTPIGRAFKGSLKDFRADELAAVPIRALVERNPEVDFAETVDVMMGAASGVGGVMGAASGCPGPPPEPGPSEPQAAIRKALALLQEWSVDQVASAHLQRPQVADEILSEDQEELDFPAVKDFGIHGQTGQGLP